MNKKILISIFFAAVLQTQPIQAVTPKSYMPVVDKESFEDVKKRLSKQKPKAEERFRTLLKERYDLADRAIPGISMTRGKKIQEGVRIKLPKNTSWNQLATMTPEEIQQKN